MRDRASALPALKTIDIGGQILGYREAGEGPPLVLLHGTLANGDTWRRVIGPLSETFRCIAPDLPLGGHRHAFAEDVDLSAPGIARIVHGLASALRLPPFVLVGNDTGGAYAQVFAARHPDWVSHLVLSNCDALDVFPPKRFAAMQKAVATPGYLAVMAALFRFKPFLRSKMAMGLLSNSLDGAQIHERFTRHFVESSRVRRNFRSVVQGWSPTHTLEAARTLSRFDKPVLLIWGEDDLELFPMSLARRLADVFQNARLEIVPASMTYVHEDQPAEFVHRLRAFVRPAA